METTSTFINGDAREVLARMPDNSVHCCVTSPPYWGLRDYGIQPSKWADGWIGQLGHEPTVDQYVEHLVEVFRSVWRVLRDDGTLWLNLGDCYAGTTKRAKPPSEGAKNRSVRVPKRPSRLPGLKPKDLVGLPWRVAFALQKAGWWLRADIVWSKPNPMPESVTDRPTKSHEYVFLLTKSKRYHYDAVASAESLADSTLARVQHAVKNNARFDPTKHKHSPGVQSPMKVFENALPGILARKWRNRRTVWTIPPQPFRGAHFAVFPEKLVEPCLRAGTSEKGCCSRCGTPWIRIVRKRASRSTGQGGLRAITARRDPQLKAYPVRYEVQTTTEGWKPGCRCKTRTKPCTVMDPFAGSGTTGIVALKQGCNFIGIDMNPDYVEMARRRLSNRKAGLDKVPKPSKRFHFRVDAVASSTPR